MIYDCLEVGDTFAVNRASAQILPGLEGDKIT
jgi:hypothetical protein